MKTYFFIGIAGTGMSAIAQYLVGKNNIVLGSDRLFLDQKGEKIKSQLENKNIKCFSQGQTSENDLQNVDYVVVSTAIEDSVHEFALAKKLGLKIIHRSDLLAKICQENYTIAVSGTSGKSTVTAMIFSILHDCNYSPSLISGAGLESLIEKGEIGNAYCGKSDILVIETDESDGTIIKYKPKIGVILNIDKDHKEISELIPLFETFKKNSLQVVVNQDNIRSKMLSMNTKYDFSCKDENVGNYAYNFSCKENQLEFYSKEQKFCLNTIGEYNMQNALAAISVCRLMNISDKDIASALLSYKGIYRRSTVIYNQNRIKIIDDFAHNPAKITAQILACQQISKKVIAFFQPHGFAPSRLMKDELIENLNKTLRENDKIYFSKIFYAGGTANQDFSAKVFAENIKNAFYLEDRNQFVSTILPLLEPDTIVLIMGARDTTLKDFALSVKSGVENFY